MSDHPKEAERNLKRIVICADICLDVFRLLPPAKVGMELANVSCRFDALVDAHFLSRRWTLGALEITKSETNFGDAEIFKIDWDVETLKNESPIPIPETPLPNGVVGFGRINCCYATDHSIAFLRSIGRLFQSDITLELFAGAELVFIYSIWPLLNPSFGIVKILFEEEAIFHRFRALTSPSVCAFSKLRQITFFLAFGILQFPPDDSAEASDGQELCKWLHTPLGDGRPKVLKVNDHSINMDELKTEFLSASTGVSFIFIFSDGSNLSSFEVENSLTNERLTMKPIEIGDYHWIVVRSPIGKNADQWAEWERDALEKDAIDWKVLNFDFS